MAFTPGRSHCPRVLRDFGAGPGIEQTQAVGLSVALLFEFVLLFQNKQAQLKQTLLPDYPIVNWASFCGAKNHARLGRHLKPNNLV